MLNSCSDFNFRLLENCDLNLFIEDLWMSYFISKKLGYRLKNGKNLKNDVKIINGENNSIIAQVNLLKSLKDEFLELLRIEGEWDV